MWGLSCTEIQVGKLLLAGVALEREWKDCVTAYTPHASALSRTEEAQG